MKILAVIASVSAVAASVVAAGLPPASQLFLQNHCADCHDADTKKGGLDLTSLAFNPDNPDQFQ